MKRKFWPLLLSLVIMIQLLAGCSISNVFNPAAKAKEYSIVILPDTQAMSQSNPTNFVKMTKWIADNQQALNIKMVLHNGDVVNKGQSDEAQYQKAKMALDLIDKANIPMLIAPGNHDYDNMLKTNRNSTLFNKYFGMDRYKDKSWFGGAFEEGKSENVYAKMEFEGKKYLFFALEFGPRDPVMAWVEKIAAKYPDFDVIIDTHTYMHKYGGRTAKETEGSPQKYNASSTDGNDGEAMWQKWLRKMKNLTAVYSGHHFNPNIAWQTDLGDNGNVVFQSIQDFQAVSDRAGRIRIVKYIPSENKVETKIFNTLTGQYESGEGYDVEYSTKKPADPKKWTQIKYPAVKGQNSAGAGSEDEEEEEPKPTAAPAKAPEASPKPADTAAKPDESKAGGVVITNVDKVKEIVTIKNGNDKDINMTGWKLLSAYTEVGEQLYKFPDNFILKAGASVDLVSGPNAAEGDGKLFWNKENNWNNSKPDPAELYNEKGEKVSELTK